ncbi:P2X purinoceptor 7 [Micropterus salmoides]|uniref:P2X purinoceptor 7 n=1 Tax=Micropterus salmoides TaxID=27706 RepID=UPI0018EBF543|nr:P2X purinoceptor 7 [Micropterus salmoides]
MEEDELERPVEPVCPIAYAFEPIRRGNRAVVRRYVEQPVVVWGEERVGNATWCQCGCCTAKPTVSESICCQEADLDHVLRGQSCITMARSFTMLCREVDVLEVVMLSLKDVRAETLQRPINSCLFRLTAYRQFTLWARGHLGKKNLIPIPACVVGSIRAVFPSLEYHGFEYAYDEF